MCVISMVGDFYSDKWKPQLGGPLFTTTIQGVSKEEFDALRKEVLEMKELLKRAKAYDTEKGEPNCEQEEKIKILKKVAEAVGVSLEDIFK